MFKIITPIAFVVLAVSASNEESIDVTRRLLGEVYNNGWGPDEYQSNYRNDYDDNDRNYGHGYDYDKYRPNYDYNNNKGYNKGWNKDDHKNDYGRYGATQGGQEGADDRDNGLESRYGGYGDGYHNDYYKRDYYYKPYYPRYWSNERGKSDGDETSRVLGVKDNDEAPGDDNTLASYYGGGYYKNGYKRNYNGYKYYNDDHYGSYWANEGGNHDDAGSRLIAMGDEEAGDGNKLASRYGGYGRNDYYRYDRYYRNKYNDDGYRYWSTKGGEAAKNDREDGDEGLASRYGHGNNYYNGWYKQKDDYYKPNYGHYRANEGGNNEENNEGLIDGTQAFDGVFEVTDDNEENDNEDD